MKKVLLVMIAVAFCLSMAGIAGAVEAVKKPVATMQQAPPPVPKPCPPGFQFSGNAQATYTCTRINPTNPCPTGYNVVWGPCKKPDSMGIGGDPSCMFSCMPQNPNWQYKCSPGYVGGGGSCGGSCQKLQ